DRKLLDPTPGACGTILIIAMTRGSLNVHARTSSQAIRSRTYCISFLRFARMHSRRLCAGSGTLLRREALDELHQAAQRNARWTFRNPGLLLFRPRRAGDVEMDPGRVIGKFLEEHGRGDGSAPASAGIHDVG